MKTPRSSQADRQYQFIFEQAAIAMFQTTPEGRLLSANPAMARMLGFSSPQEIVASITEVQTQLYVHPACREEFKRSLQEQGAVQHFEAQLHRKDGSTMWVWINARMEREGGSIVRYSGTLEDITDHKLLEGQFGELQRDYRDTLENAVFGIFQSSPAGRYLSVNPAMAKMMGYDSPQELTACIADIGSQVYVDSTCRERLESLAREQGMVKNFECEIYRKNGSKVWISANIRAIFRDDIIVKYEGMNEDISHRKLMEDQLRQGQRMEAMGQLAGGVAHDFNNALSVITGYGDLLQLLLPADDPSHKHAQEIAKAGHRAAALTRQLLAFSRKQIIQPVVLDLNAATQELEKMLHRLIGEDIELTFRRTPGVWPVNMDPGQLEQVLMNLAVNSRDAMPQGGKLCIETANVELDATYVRQNTYVSPGAYVMLSVSDTGDGMDAATQLRMFEPFFTTKGPGKGTGLGLSTVYGITKQNAGYIVASSDLGQGTVFRIYLPRLEDDARPSPLPKALEVIHRGTETILVVEDEEPIRTLVRACLEGNGYSVLDAGDPVSALELSDRHSERIHLLLSDVIMPGMNGRELAMRLVALRPAVKVMYMSGYANDLIDDRGTLDRNVVLLEKPFTRHALLSKVRQALQNGENAEVPSAA
jgi:two-component system cell cycle sensor histidine kinase/response regulator CckA